MAPRKRKASPSATEPTKKVQILVTAADTDDPAPMTASGRPKRSGDVPQYNFTRRRRAAGAPKPPAAASQAVPEPPRVGRPRTLSSAPVHATSDPSIRKGTWNPPLASSPPAAAAILNGNAPAKNRGRPPKAKAATQTRRPVPSRASEDVAKDTSGMKAPVKADADADSEEVLDPNLQYWLMKAEPESRIERGHDVKFSIDDLAAKAEPEGWDGVRNPAARNNMRAMRQGDLAFFYHSNCAVPGVAGVMRIVAEHSVDESAFDPNHPYYDPKSDRAKPKWELVHVEFVKKFDALISLKALRSYAERGGALEAMQMLKQGRLSVSAVTPAEWQFILALAGEKPTLGHGVLASGYESDVDGEGYECA